MKRSITKKQWELENPPRFKHGDKIIIDDSSSCLQSELQGIYLSDRIEWIKKFKYFNGPENKQITVNGFYHRLCRVLITSYCIAETREVIEEQIK